MTFKPMLAGKVKNIADLRYPLIASPKVDGIRCLIVGGKAVSRTMKEIPNRHIFDTLSGSKSFTGLDGELTVLNKPFNEVSGDVMRSTGTPDFTYLVFDFWPSSCTYRDRLKLLCQISPKFPPAIQMLSWRIIHTDIQLIQYEEECLNQGFEGIMVRDPQGKYKFGRSTTNEQILLKLKRFEDSEAIVLGFIEEMYNGNEALKDAFGRTKRSSHQANLVGKCTLGALHCKDLKTGIEFDIGTGFTSVQREHIWNERKYLLDSIVKYRHQAVGAKDLPRFPSFIGFRSTEDM